MASLSLGSMCKLPYQVLSSPGHSVAQTSAPGTMRSFLQEYIQSTRLSRVKGLRRLYMYGFLDHKHRQRPVQCL